MLKTSVGERRTEGKESGGELRRGKQRIGNGFDPARHQQPIKLTIYTKARWGINWAELQAITKPIVNVLVSPLYYNCNRIQVD